MRWGGEFEVDTVGRWEYTIEAWADSFGTWRDELRRKLAAGQPNLDGELSEGIVLIRAAAERARQDEDRAVIERGLAALESDPTAALNEQLLEVVER